MKRLFTSVALASLSCAASPSLAAELLINGGFETPSAYFTTYTGTQIPGWTVTTNNVDIASNAIYGSTTYAYEGSQWLDLVGSGRSGAIAQSFATTVGNSYVLSFAYANNPDFTPAAGSVVVSGLGTVLSSVVTHAGSTRVSAGWALYSQSFIADAATTTLTFTDTSHNLNAGIYLDAVSIMPSAAGSVPEASSWAMMIVGWVPRAPRCGGGVDRSSSSAELQTLSQAL